MSSTSQSYAGPCAAVFPHTTLEGCLVHLYGRGIVYNGRLPPTSGWDVHAYTHTGEAIMITRRTFTTLLVAGMTGVAAAPRLPWS